MISFLKRLFWISIGIIAFSSCSIEPVPIAFGEDQCYSCKMMISDRRFGGELISQKGKVFKFDAMECLLGYLEDKNESDYKFILAVPYSDPGTLIDARTAFYVIHPDHPSPMGANLSVFKELDSIPAYISGEEKGILNWVQIKKSLSR